MLTPANGAPAVSDNFYTTNADGALSMVTSASQALLVPTPDGKNVRAYLAVATTDLSPPVTSSQTTSSASQLLKGGLSLCVMTLGQSYDFRACNTPRPDASGEALDGFVFSDATTLFRDNRYMVGPTIVRLAATPSGAVYIYAVNRMGSIASLKASAGSWTATSWDTTGGRPATCTDTLNKPAAPAKPEEAPTFAKSFWRGAIWSTVKTALFTGLEITGEATIGPVATLVVGALSDELLGVSENVSDARKEEADKAGQIYSEWADIYDKVDMTISCSF